MTNGQNWLTLLFSSVIEPTTIRGERGQYYREPGTKVEPAKRSEFIGDQEQAEPAVCAPSPLAPTQLPLFCSINNCAGSNAHEEGRRRRCTGP